MSGHTPGPWRITLMGAAMDGDFRHQIGTHAKTVAYTYDGIQEPTAEHTANARLIAAAPELLKACELFAAYDLVEHDDFETMVTAYAEAIEATRAAIAKAAGETK